MAVAHLYHLDSESILARIVIFSLIVAFCGCIPEDEHYPNNSSEQLKSEDLHNRYTDKIPVDVLVKPCKFDSIGKIYVATGVNFSAKAVILAEKFRNVSIEYQWSVKNLTITTGSNASEIVYKFDKADPSNFLEVLVFHHPNDTGISNKSLVVRDPVRISELEGKRFLEHGELLDIKIKFNGTGPFKYCKQFCPSTGRGKACKSCRPEFHTDRHEVRIIQYLHPVGNYTLEFVVDNVASRQSESYLVRITETVRPKTLPLVPIISSILAVIIVLLGVALHIKLNRAIDTETADFDFIREDYLDEDFWDEEQSFMQRVRCLLRLRFHSDQDTSMIDSNMSGTSRS